MPVKCTVLYPSENLEFDMSYYMTKHMPLVYDHWHKHGLSDWSVVKFENGPDGTPPQYGVQATLTFDKVESVKAAVEKDGGPVFGDVKNFSNKGPVFLMGEQVGTS